MLKGAHAIVRIEDVLKAEKMETELTELKVSISNSVTPSEDNTLYVEKSEIDRIIREYAYYAKDIRTRDYLSECVDSCKIVYV